MSDFRVELAVNHGLVVGVVPFLVGLVLVGLLVGAVWRGLRRRSRVPRPEEQPRLPEGGPVGQVVEQREPAEVPRSHKRLTPHRLRGFGNQGTRPSADRPHHSASHGPDGPSGSTDPSG
ncbi:DUF6479 family protein [Streptomyces sp. NPDC059991]|uniref:DUF6479 family protein n=1 Tax=unclassified Streptomyces TaxID=2593676 RepID=UPI003683470B